MLSTWETDRLLLRVLGPEASAAVRDYGLRTAEYHRPFDPIRPGDFWELPVVADRLVCQRLEAEQDRSLCLFISLKEQPNRVIGAINLRNIIRGAMMGASLGWGSPRSLILASSPKRRPPLLRSSGSVESESPKVCWRRLSLTHRGSSAAPLGAFTWHTRSTA